MVSVPRVGTGPSPLAALVALDPASPLAQVLAPLLDTSDGFQRTATPPAAARAASTAEAPPADPALASELRLRRDATLGVGDRSRAVKAAEKKLKKAGFNPGPVDGTYSVNTARAVRQFQAAVGVPVTGEIDARTQRQLTAVDKRIERHDGDLMGPGQKSRRILQAEKRLDRLGYDVGRVDGVYDRETGAAMQKFRADQGKKKGSLLMGGPTEDALKKESAAFGHDPQRIRVRPSAARRREDARTKTAAERLHADGTRGMGEGSEGRSVSWVQRHLRAAGYDPKSVKGKFDERTRGAVEQFQKQSGLPVTGRVDGRTWNRLSKATMETRSSLDPAQREGERSSGVLRTERMLKKLGYNPGKVDGLYTENTQRAVDRFRRRERLGSIGSGVGRRVHNELRQEIKERANRIPTRRDTGYRNGNPFPVKLGKVDGHWTGYKTALAYRRMERAARKDGIDLDIVSGFRTMAKQRELYNLYGPGRAARPGYSNHQNGIALDFNVQTAPGQMAVGVGPVYNWLARNAHKYGFQRIALEAWHWEYKR